MKDVCMCVDNNDFVRFIALLNESIYITGMVGVGGRRDGKIYIIAKNFDDSILQFVDTINSSTNIEKINEKRPEIKPFPVIITNFSSGK